MRCVTPFISLESLSAALIVGRRLPDLSLVCHARCADDGEGTREDVRVRTRPRVRGNPVARPGHAPDPAETRQRGGGEAVKEGEEGHVAGSREGNRGQGSREEGDGRAGSFLPNGLRGTSTSSYDACRMRW